MSGNRGIKNWRSERMRYNGRYPVNEMWDVRQALIQDFSRNVSTNKYLAAMDRKCFDYVQNCRDNRFKKYNWRNQEKRDTAKDFDNQDDELGQNWDENQYHQGETSSCNDDIPNDRFYLDFDGDKREFELTNAKLLVKEEPETSDNERTNVSYVAKTFSDSNVDIRNESKGFRSKSDIETNTLSREEKIETENNVDTLEHSCTTCDDVVDGCSLGNSDLLVDENEEVTESEKSESSEKRKSKKFDTPKKGRSKELDSPEKLRSKELDSPEKLRSKELDSPEKLRSKELDRPEKQNSKTFEKIKNYKQFVKTVSKLVNKKRKEDSNDKQKEEVDINNEVSENSKNSTSNSENKNTQKVCTDKTNGKSKLKTPKTTDKKDAKIIRSTRSSSRSAKVIKVDAVEKKSIKKKDSRVAKPLDSKQNSSNMKSRNKYKSRLRSNSENLESGDEGAVTSTSKQLVKEKDNVKVKKRKLVSSPDEDIPLAKYSKFLSNDIGTKGGSDQKELDKENELDETIDYSNSDENKPTGNQIENISCSDGDFSNHKLLQGEKNEVKLLKNSYSDGTVNQNENDLDKSSSPTKNDVCEIIKDSEEILDSSLIIIDESDSSKKPECEFQISTDLDCYNNNKDKISESDKVYSTSSQEEKLWEYLKCDFCDFLVSKKKLQNYQLMEEHLESTKHNAASIVKVSITDGELKPLFVKKEHAILFSLEKASILPYCPTCCTVMPSIWTVQLHARFKHPNHVQKDIYSLGKVESVVNVPIPKKIDMCKQCGQRKIHIQKHWKSHNHYPYVQPTDDQIALYSCNICHRHFESFFSALSHAVVHSQDGQRRQNIGVRVTYLCKSNQTLTLLPREKTLTSGRAIEMLNQARAANKTGQWTRSQRKEFETMAIEWKRRFKQH